MDSVLSSLSQKEREKLGGLSEVQLWNIVKKQAMRDEKQMEEASKQLQFLLAAGGWEGMASRATALLERRALKIHFVGKQQSEGRVVHKTAHQTLAGS